MQKMKLFLFLLNGFISTNVFGQTEYKIKGFSEKYMGILTIEEGFENEVFKKGKISIIKTNTNKQIIEINADELIFELDKKGAVKTNVLELPYGEQSVLIYEDFNFDGKKDLAIMDGQYSCYHGPSFQIYLENGDGLKHSPAFTQLAQQYCGMFQIDTDTKTIHTMTKSGCCWHQFSEFKVIDNIPTPVLVIEEAYDFPFLTRTITEWEGNKKRIKTEKTIDLQQEGITELFSFKLVKNQKKVSVFNINNRILNYTFMASDQTVEFSYPIESVYKNPDFKINKKEDRLIFENKNATYEIYEIRKLGNLDKIGVIVKVNGKRYDLKGDLSSLKGCLKNIKEVKLDNVIYE